MVVEATGIFIQALNLVTLLAIYTHHILSVNVLTFSLLSHALPSVNPHGSTNFIMVCIYQLLLVHSALSTSI